jgi:hypothetical protein
MSTVEYYVQKHLDGTGGLRRGATGSLPGCFLCCTESIVSNTLLVLTKFSPDSTPFEEDEQLDTRAATPSYLPAMHWRMVCRPRWVCVWEWSREACQESGRMSSQSEWPSQSK